MENINTSSPLTFEQVMAMLEKRNEETFAKLEEYRKESERKFQASMEEYRKESLRKSEESERKFQASMEESERRFQESMRESKRQFNKSMGELTRRFGEIIEYMIAPDLCVKFKRYGFNFQQANTRQEIFDGKEVITEIDILLEDGDSTMAVEVKSCPSMYDLQRHIKRMEEIKTYPPRSVRGTRLYGAISGAVVKKDIRVGAFDAGLYVVCQTGENVNIIPPPEDFVAKCWDVTNV